MPNHAGRELVLSVPLAEDRGLRDDGRPKVRRFRTFLLDLGPRLRSFRRAHDLTQAEVARALDLGDRSAITGWEKGTTVPDGICRERLVALLDGRLWGELRRAILVGEGMPRRWLRAVRWYRRLSRERRHRETEGRAIAAAMGPLRDVGDTETLRQEYRQSGQAWDGGALGTPSSDAYRQSGRYRAEDAAYGLRWLEIAEGTILDLGRSLVPQLASGVLDRIAPGAGAPDTSRDDA